MVEIVGKQVGFVFFGIGVDFEDYIFGVFWVFWDEEYFDFFFIFFFCQIIKYVRYILGNGG